MVFRTNDHESQTIVIFIYFIMSCYPQRIVAPAYNELTFNDHYMINNELLDHFCVINTERLNILTRESYPFPTFFPSFPRTLEPSYRRILTILVNRTRRCNLLNEELVFISGKTVCFIICNIN